MNGTDFRPARGPGFRLLIFVLITSAVAAGPASAQNTRTWDGGAGTTAWFTATNWNPDTSFPGLAGLNANTDQALFGTVGTSVTASGITNPGFSLGAIATPGRPAGS